MDLIISFGQQTMVHRMVLFFNSGEVFPPGFADEALEVGPHRNTHGPGLLALLNVHMPPEAAAAWLASEPRIARHAQRSLWLRRGAEWATGTLEELAAAAGAPGVLPADATGVRVVAAPKKLAATLTPLLPEDFPLEPRTPSHHLCVASLPSGGDLTAGQHGQWAGQYCPWAGQAKAGKWRGGGRRRPAPGAEGEEEEEQPGVWLDVGPVPHEFRWSLVPASWCWLMPCLRIEGELAGAPGTAVHKLDEALRLLGLSTPSSHRAGAWALDLGASPGAWTRHLAGLGFRVVAIDPGELDAGVLAMPGVYHIAARSEEAAERVAALVYGQGSGANGGNGGGGGGKEGGGEVVAEEVPGDGADVLCSDMNMHPFQAAIVVRPLLKLLRPGGLLILTLKLPGSGRERGPLVAHVRDLLGDAIDPDSVRSVWLMSNTACERTLIARRAAGPTWEPPRAAAVEEAAKTGAVPVAAGVAA